MRSSLSTHGGFRDLGDLGDLRDLRELRDLRDLRDFRDLRELKDLRDPSNPANPILGTLGTPRISGTQRPRDFKRSLVAPRVLGLEGILARTSRRVPLSLGILQHHRVMQKHKMPKPRHTHTHAHIANGPQHHNIISQLCRDIPT